MAPSSKARHWEHAPYAVVVPESEQKRDVIPASPSLAKATKSPFGVSIFSERIQFYESPLPLIYVSPEAALDRAPGRYSTNGGGVRAGWYAIAQPGRFKVRVTKFEHVRMAPRCRGPADDAFSLKLDVDGMDTRQHRHFSDDSHEQCTVFAGFVEKRVATPGEFRAREAVLRPFTFEKVAGVQGPAEGGSHVGEIQMNVRSGRKTRDVGKVKTRVYGYSNNNVSEKLVAKEGRSLQASRSVAKEQYTSHTPAWHIIDRREIEEARITIFVRERSWLHSRRIIDDDDLPVSYEALVAMLEEDKVRVGGVGVVDVDDAPPNKRRKIKEQMRLTDEFEPVQPGEIIDLT